MMLKNFLRLGTRHITQNVLRRKFLSDAYKCTEAWENRLKAEVFKKIDFDDLYYQMDRSFQIGYKISVLDIDLYANGLKQDESHIPELEDLLFRLRLNPEAGSVHESTGHAVVRYYWTLDKLDDLIRVMNDRLNYGIFPEPYLSNLLIDTLLKKDDYISAIRFAVFQMLQEDFVNPITRDISLFSCYKYLNSDQVWKLPVEKLEQNDEEEEEIKVRVRFIRNPYFDDHFDLREPNHLVGKTLSLAGEASNNSVGVSSQVIGLTLREKYSDLKTLLNELNSKNLKIHRNAIELTKQYLQKLPKLETEVEITEDQKTHKGEIINLLNKLETSNQVLEGNLENDVKTQLETSIKDHEKNDIEYQCQTYKRWEDEREQNIAEEIFEDNRQKAIEEIQKTKEDLHLKEEELFYFDNEDKWDMVVEKKTKKKEEIASKIPKKRKKDEDIDYIPPEVGKKTYGSYQ